MDHKEANHSIKCSVKQCEYHCGDGNFCTLDAIKVGTHEADPTVCECTDCQSFARCK
ncbi:MAG: DUF1540 domain-containing protein [Bacillota bacterium]|nr:DUF1540 domain-containing protein [Bacillota bacterium]